MQTVHGVLGVMCDHNIQLFINKLSSHSFFNEKTLMDDIIAYS